VTEWLRKSAIESLKLQDVLIVDNRWKWKLFKQELSNLMIIATRR
jgi:hypothetical protein